MNLNFLEKDIGFIDNFIEQLRGIKIWIKNLRRIYHKVTNGEEEKDEEEEPVSLSVSLVISLTAGDSFEEE
jgi:hypothetical protein